MITLITDISYRTIDKLPCKKMSSSFAPQPLTDTAQEEGDRFHFLVSFLLFAQVQVEGDRFQLPVAFLVVPY